MGLCCALPLSGAALVACGDGATDDGTDVEATMMDLTVQFAARVGDADVACDTAYEGLGTTGVTGMVKDFRLYVHDVALLDADGNATMLELDQDDTWQYENVALLDFETNCDNGTAATHTMIEGQIPAGDYVGLTFKVGVPEELNHADTAAAPAPLNDSSLWWNWMGGYKHARLDFVLTADADGNEMTKPAVFHLGSTMCTGEPPAEDATCQRGNRPELTFDAFDVDSEMVVLDYAKLVENEDLAVDLGGAGAGCMSSGMDMDCVEPFDALGMDLGSGSVGGPQAVFSVEAM